MELILPVCELVHREAQKLLFDGGVAVDATMGNGEDTVFLCAGVGGKGKVYAFDIQDDAIAHTEERLKAAGLCERARLIKAGHQHMAGYIEEAVDVVVFNLGYLPGGDHSLTTTAATTIEALNVCLKLLKPGGAILIALYWGHPEGTKEKAAIEAFLTTLPTSAWSVAQTAFPNRQRAPQLIEIQKKR